MGENRFKVVLGVDLILENEYKTIQNISSLDLLFLFWNKWIKKEWWRQDSSPIYSLSPETLCDASYSQFCCRYIVWVSLSLFRSRKLFPMQIDGEPWMQPPAEVWQEHFTVNSIWSILPFKGIFNWPHFNLVSMICHRDPENEVAFILRRNRPVLGCPKP